MASTIRFKKVNDKHVMCCMYNLLCNEEIDIDGLCAQHRMMAEDMMAILDNPPAIVAHKVAAAEEPPIILYGKLKRRGPNDPPYKKDTLHIDGDVVRRWNGIDKFIDRCSQEGCTLDARKNGKCINHDKGVFKLDRGGAKEGEIFTAPDGTKYKIRGTRNNQICRNEGCMIEAAREGLCKSHSPHYKCAHDGCTNIKVGATIFCKGHAV